MKRYIRSTKTTYNVGDVVKYDSNWRGVTPHIDTGRIVHIKSGLASHGDTNPPPILTIESNDGRRIKLDGSAVVEVIASKSIKAAYTV